MSQTCHHHKMSSGVEEAAEVGRLQRRRDIVDNNVAHPHNDICRAVIQNGNREPGARGRFSMGNLDWERQKLAKLLTTFHCAVNWGWGPPLSGYHMCRVRCWHWAPRCRINLRDCSAGGWPGQLSRHYHFAESVPLPGETIMKNLNGIPAVPVPWAILVWNAHW